MANSNKPPVLVVLQLTGGNDYFNTVIPYTDGNYYDSRRSLGISENRVLKLNDQLGSAPCNGADEGYLRQWRPGRDPWHRLRELTALTLPLYGHLAYVRAG